MSTMAAGIRQLKQIFASSQQIENKRVCVAT